MAGLDPFATPTVAVQNVHVRYKAPSVDAAERLRGSAMARLAQRAVGRQPQVMVRALSDVSFVARSGEQIGIVGQNGSGKSTLLRVIAGLERPVRGQVLADSTPVLVGVNAALIPDLSGVENIRLGCLAMGMTPAQADAAAPAVIELANLGKSIYLPMKTYSSGMGSRLRFAIATAARPHILLVDEALATGDAAFKERSDARVRQMRDEAGTVFLVSHAAQTIEETCTRAIWLNHGRLVLDGPAEDVALQYRKWAWAIAKDQPQEAKRIIESAFAQRQETRVHVAEPKATRRYRPRHVPRNGQPANYQRPATEPLKPIPPAEQIAALHARVPTKLTGDWSRHWVAKDTYESIHEFYDGDDPCAFGIWVDGSIVMATFIAFGTIHLDDALRRLREKGWNSLEIERRSHRLVLFFEEVPPGAVSAGLIDRLAATANALRNDLDATARPLPAGYIDGINDDRTTVTGWVKLNRDGTIPALQVRLGNEAVGNIQYGSPRGDVEQRLGIQNARFTINLPSALTGARVTDGSFTVEANGRPLDIADTVLDLRHR